MPRPALFSLRPVVLLAGLVLSTAAAAAQSRHVLPLQYGPPVTGAPFSGVRTLDFEPVASAADTTPFHAEEIYFRDSAGRTRSEITYPGRTKTIDILDPVSGKHFRWTDGATQAAVFPMPAPRADARLAVAETLPPDALKIEGVPTRHATSSRGTDDAQQMIESWYAPSLHVAMVTIIDKPSEGKTTYRFQHVKLGEPDAALFAPSKGMNIDDRPPVNVAGQNSQSSPAGTSALSVMSDIVETGTASQATNAAGLKPRSVEADYLSDPKFQRALAEAKTGRMTQEDRLSAWKRASKIAKNQCVECLHRMVVLQDQLRAYKDLVATSVQLEAVAADNPREVLFAKAERGSALMRYNYGEPKPEQVQEAEALFAEVLKRAPHQLDVLYLEGRALAMQHRDADAKAAFARYAEIAPAGNKLRARAERFSDDPHLATLHLAPPFHMITADGQDMELDEMNGKVVLLDFWATWCGPCKETIPTIARLAKDYANDPMVVVVSVSQDRDDVAWKNFVQKNHMDWPQYRDANNSLGAAYNVSSIPRFFTIDTDGVLHAEQVGSNANVRVVVDDLVKKAHKAEAKKAAATDRARPGQ